MSVIGGGITVIVQLVLVVPAARPEESTTFAVKLKAPGVVGVPVMAPVAGFRVRPGGRLPAVIENVNGACPPVVVNAEL
jgi:hypothetical protein